MLRSVTAASVAVAAYLAGGCSTHADMVVYNANIYTVDAETPRATAFAISNGRFVAVGDSSILSAFSAERAIDARGATIVPGLIDSHGHLLKEGLARLNANLVGTVSMDEVVGRLIDHAASVPAGDWIYGRGWDQNDWEIKEFPDRSDLDGAFPDRPVWIERIDGHASLLNTAALRAMGFSRLDETPDPPGGRLVRDEAGRLTGLFIDAAEDMVEAAAPPPSPERLVQALRIGSRALVEHGLTGVHDPGLKLDSLDIYLEAAEAGDLPVRVYAMIDAGERTLSYYCARGPIIDYGGRLTVRAVKIYGDGALGSRGAALLEPYSDAPESVGLLRRNQDQLEELLRRVSGCGFQPAVHAIGDRAVRSVLDAYESIESISAADRPRIEHAQVVHPDDMHRFAELGVIAAMQPTHATSDMSWAEERLGPDRVKGAYAWRSIIDSGARIAFGSDFPVESIDPIRGFHAAVTRQDAAGRPHGGWFPDQRVTRQEALRGFTIDAAYAGFAEEEVGSITVGKRADFVLLDRDIMTVPSDEILDATVVATFMDGIPAFESGL